MNNIFLYNYLRGREGGGGGGGGGGEIEEDIEGITTKINK